MSQITIYDSSGIVGDVETLTPDSGGPVSPDGAGNIDVPGGNGINTVGTPNTVTFNIIPSVYSTNDATVETNGATTTTLLSVTVPANQSLTFSTLVVGADTADASKMIGTSSGLIAYNTGGGAVLGPTANNPVKIPLTPATVYITFDVSGDDVRIRVTGAAGQTYRWKANARYQLVDLT